LPASCWESAEMLDKQRGIYERYGVFPANIIDGVIGELRRFGDKGIREELGGNLDKMREVVRGYYYCG